MVSKRQFSYLPTSPSSGQATTYSQMCHATLLACHSGEAFRKPVLAKPRHPSSCEMPAILRSGPYRFYFYSHEPNEPPHVHVDRDKASRKVWLSPVALASSLGFRASELREVRRLVSSNKAILLKALEEFDG